MTTPTRQASFTSRGRARDRRRRLSDREGAAMLMVLMVLMMTTATATFAIHSTTIELRSAGYARTAMQTSYVAEGAVFAASSYIDAIGPTATLVQYARTQVGANVSMSAFATTRDQDTNLLRIHMDDFASASGINGVPVETDPTRVESLGPRTNLTPSFTVDGTDIYIAADQIAGETQGGGSPFGYVRGILTAEGRLAPPIDVTTTGDQRSFHESASKARAVIQVGPVPINN